MQLLALLLVLAFSSSNEICQIEIKEEVIHSNTSDTYEIKLNVLNGVEPYQYYWFSEKSTNTVIDGVKDQTDLKEGKYIVVVQDAIGCHRTKQFTVK